MHIILSLIKYNFVEMEYLKYHNCKKKRGDSVMEFADLGTTLETEIEG